MSYSKAIWTVPDPPERLPALAAIAESSSSASSTDMPSRRCPTRLPSRSRLTKAASACCRLDPSARSNKPSNEPSVIFDPAMKSRCRTRQSKAETTKTCGALCATEVRLGGFIAGRGGTLLHDRGSALLGSAVSPSLGSKVFGSNRPSPSLSVSSDSHSIWLCVMYGSACIRATRNSCCEAREPSRCNAGPSRFGSICSMPAASAGTPIAQAASAAVASCDRGSVPAPKPRIWAKMGCTSARDMPSGNTLTASMTSSRVVTSGLRAKRRSTSTPGPGARARPKRCCDSRRRAASARPVPPFCVFEVCTAAVPPVGAAG
mmetsp:Transcript_109087/g.260289  ORF Transcript_109087/g.260289 Transcript_109087/m.260289 type:complete len:318 (+) Transcript_109087:647-1600(+)